MLADIPMLVILVALAAYAVLAGADFGAGSWTLLSPSPRLRDHARHAMGPVWEANHVWLILILVVCWTGYPTAFGSIASTLGIPLFIAALGIILRGTAYALRGVSEADARIERLFALSSVLTPFALGTVAGAIASGRVPVGNAAGDEWSSWLNATALALGALFVVCGAYLAAVYLAADARRLGEPDLERAFRVRALAGGLVAGAAAVAALIVVRADARPIFDGLTSGAGIAALVVSGAAGLATLALVWRERYEAARYAAALAVAAIIAGWALAQEPRLLPGLTVHDAAAGHATLVALVIALAAGALLLLPALALLFGLFLGGAFDPTDAPAGAPAPGRPARIAPLALPLALLALGTLLTVLVDAGWGRFVGVPLLLLFALSLFGRVANV
jgi:cytochrome d ubiquinol oxidase subunit II